MSTENSRGIAKNGVSSIGRRWTSNQSHICIESNEENQKWEESNAKNQSPNSIN